MNVSFLRESPLNAWNVSHPCAYLVDKALKKAPVVKPGLKIADKAKNQCFFQPGLWREASSSITCSMRSPLEVSSTIRW